MKEKKYLKEKNNKTAAKTALVCTFEGGGNFLDFYKYPNL